MLFSPVPVQRQALSYRCINNELKSFLCLVPELPSNSADRAWQLSSQHRQIGPDAFPEGVGGGWGDRLIDGLLKLGGRHSVRIGSRNSA
jgi:hypothetical protein